MADFRGLEDENPKARAALRDQKPRLDLLEPAADELAAQALANGAEKYGRQNYLTIPISYRGYLAAMKRHINELLDGVDADKDSGVNPLGHVLANGHVLAAAMKHGNLVDDRGPEERTPEQEARSATSNGLVVVPSGMRMPDES